MYYLTKSNGIISDKQLKESKGIFKCGSSICYYVNIDDDEFETLDHIIKESDNVFDLIEVGDLIAFKYMNTGIIDIANVGYIYKYKDGDIDISTRGYVHRLDKITAIYKPNSKGDYIKVWEKENEE